MASKLALGLVAMVVVLFAAIAIFVGFTDLTASGQSELTSSVQSALVFLSPALVGGLIAGYRALFVATCVWLGFWGFIAGASSIVTMLAAWPAMLGSGLSMVAGVMAGAWLVSIIIGSRPNNSFKPKPLRGSA